MTTLKKVAGLDPSMRNFGMVKGVLDIRSGAFFPEDIELVETTIGKGKKTVRKNSDDLRRAQSIFKSMTDFIKDVDLVFVEIPVGSQTARAMASYGMCIGILASIGKGMIQVTPTEVKLAACNKKTATKLDMITWAVQAHPKLDWFTRKSKGNEVLTLKNEHIADAVATVYAGVETEQFNQLKSII